MTKLIEGIKKDIEQMDEDDSGGSDSDPSDDDLVKEDQEWLHENMINVLDNYHHVGERIKKIVKRKKTVIKDEKIQVKEKKKEQPKKIEKKKQQKLLKPIEQNKIIQPEQKKQKIIPGTYFILSVAENNNCTLENPLMINKIISASDASQYYTKLKEKLIAQQLQNAVKQNGEGFSYLMQNCTPKYIQYEDIKRVKSMEPMIRKVKNMNKSIHKIMEDGSSQCFVKEFKTSEILKLTGNDIINNERKIGKFEKSFQEHTTINESQRNSKRSMTPLNRGSSAIICKQEKQKSFPYMKQRLDDKKSTSMMMKQNDNSVISHFNPNNNSYQPERIYLQPVSQKAPRVGQPFPASKSSNVFRMQKQKYSVQKKKEIFSPKGFCKLDIDNKMVKDPKKLKVREETQRKLTLHSEGDQFVNTTEMRRFNGNSYPRNQIMQKNNTDTQKSFDHEQTHRKDSQDGRQQPRSVNRSNDYDIDKRHDPNYLQQYYSNSFQPHYMNAKQSQIQKNMNQRYLNNSQMMGNITASSLLSKSKMGYRKVYPGAVIAAQNKED